ncbi:hypothetical protein [Thermococcus sp. Bubb.Bath]|uniref:hypothetical protein n=1 Tax=Thermococcus sp. Bubb.Bath TaxID=1638242 RepID=UPI00143ABB14|nr:hypothetical protein [Thermococcus sp. Bubb.Bath]
MGENMEKVDRISNVPTKNDNKLALNKDKKQKIKRFRGILGKSSEETVLWAIKEAEEL